MLHAVYTVMTKYTFSRMGIAKCTLTIAKCTLTCSYFCLVFGHASFSQRIALWKLCFYGYLNNYFEAKEILKKILKIPNLKQETNKDTKT